MVEDILGEKTVSKTCSAMVSCLALPAAVTSSKQLPWAARSCLQHELLEQLPRTGQTQLMFRILTGLKVKATTVMASFFLVPVV